jgi:hypothetical protein
MDLKPALQALINKWDEEASAWREAGKMARSGDPQASLRNYARANILESCVETIEQLIQVHEES